MNLRPTIIVFMLFLTSCTNKPEAEGFWRLSYHERVENYFTPFGLYFHQNSLIIMDGHNFQQATIYTKVKDSISIIFENGVKKNYPCSFISDSIIQFANLRYIRPRDVDTYKLQPYQLLGWNSSHRFEPKIGSETIHLIKDYDSTKVILNYETFDLEYLNDFLEWYHQKPKINLYIGKAIELKDLLDVYCWMKYRNYHSVELVTWNVSFEKFNSVIDFIELDSLVFNEFIEKNNLSPLPSPPPIVFENMRIVDIIVKSEMDLDFNQHSDTFIYRYNFSTKLNIIKYLELSKKLYDSKTKYLKRLTI